MIVESFRLAPCQDTPNNPRLPVILFREAYAEPDVSAAAFENTFAAHGWQGIWRNGIYAFHHYHSGAHEVLGIARGEGRVILGGADGREFTLVAGDCLILPAGTGHCRLAASPDFLVIGAYPRGQHADMQTCAPDAAMLARIRDCPLPDDDPLDSADGTLAELWRAALP